MDLKNTFDSFFTGIRNALDWHDRSADEFQNRGLEAYGEGHLGSAISHYRSALSLAPDNADLHSRLGQLYYEQDELVEAEQAFRAALQLDSSHLRALKGLAFTLHARDDSEAIHLYLRYLQLDREDPDVLLNLGLMLANQHLWEEALPYYDQSELLNPDDAVIPEVRARALFALGRYAEAKASLGRSRQLDPENPETLQLFGQTNEALGDDDAAFQNYEAALELDSDHADTHFDLAELMARTEKWEGVAEHAQIAATELAKLGDNEFSAKAYWSLGWALFKLGRFNESVRASRDALKLDPSLAPVYFNIGLALLCDKEPKKARDEYETGVKSVPDPEEISYHGINDLNDALRERSQIEGAEEILRFLEESYQRLQRPGKGTS